MKKTLSLALAITMAAAVTSCKEEKKSDDIIIDTIITEQQTGPQHMSKEEHDGSVTWIGGAEYTYHIVREACDSLGTTENNGQEYYNNTVKLTVHRADGTTFFKKTFTKANFAPAMPKKYRDTGILLGMNLEKVDGNVLRFVVNVGSPDESNEEFVYVLMTLDNYGATRAMEYKTTQGTEASHDNTMEAEG